jgi:hypothetical protein
MCSQDYCQRCAKYCKQIAISFTCEIHTLGCIKISAGGVALRFLIRVTNSWELEIEWEREDPMFAAALRTDSSIFVEDVEIFSSYVKNAEV